jgi:hypothetical protein
MIIAHSLEFETEIAEDSEAYNTIQNMPEHVVKIMFEQMLKDLVAPRLTPILDELNAGNSWATLRVAQ